jgi:hypothetical protein
MFSMLLCLGLAHSVNATVLFYKQNLSVAITGGGRVMNRIFSGFTLIDTANGDLAFVSADVKSKRFKVEQPEHSLTTIQPSSNNTRTILSINSGNGEGLNAKGANTSLNVGTFQTVVAPATFVVSGCDAYTPSGLPSAYLFEYRGAIVYDRVDTVSATQANATLSTCIDQVRQILGSKGYVEE